MQRKNIVLDILTIIENTVKIKTLPKKNYKELKKEQVSRKELPWNRKRNLQRGDWMRLTGLLRTEDGELFTELLEIFSEISSCNWRWCCWALLRIKRNFRSFSFSRALPVNGHTLLKCLARADCSPKRKLRPRPWLYNHSAFKLKKQDNWRLGDPLIVGWRIDYLSIGSTIKPSITLKFKHQFKMKGR